MKHSSVKAIIAVCLLGTLFCSSSCKESYENKIRRYESEGKTIINNLPFYEDHFHIVFKDNDKFFLDDLNSGTVTDVTPTGTLANLRKELSYTSQNSQLVAKPGEEARAQVENGTITINSVEKEITGTIAVSNYGIIFYTPGSATYNEENNCYLFLYSNPGVLYSLGATKDFDVIDSNLTYTWTPRSYEFHIEGLFERTHSSIPEGTEVRMFYDLETGECKPVELNVIALGKSYDAYYFQSENDRMVEDLNRYRINKEIKEIESKIIDMDQINKIKRNFSIAEQYINTTQYIKCVFRQIDRCNDDGEYKDYKYVATTGYSIYGLTNDESFTRINYPCEVIMSATIDYLGENETVFKGCELLYVSEIKD